MLELGHWSGFAICMHQIRKFEARANAVHAVCTQCKVLDGGKYSDPTFGPLWQVFGSILGFFFSFLCIWDVAHLNCHPFLPIFNHFYPFFIPHIGLSPLWGTQEGRGDVAIVNSPHYRANFEFLAKYLIHSLDSGDFSVSAKKKINAKKSNDYGIQQHILEEMYADLKEIN